MAGKVRQAIVVVHGMGEQRPLQTLNTFVEAGLPPDADGRRYFYSRPDIVTDSYESRRYLAPPRHRDGRELNAQTEYFEYHWSYHIQGNRLADMAPTMRRMLLQPPWKVPSGLRVVWAVFWALVIAVAVAIWSGRLAVDGITLERVVVTLVGAGLVGSALVFVLTKLVPSWITSSFVDVVRYLDTSPRSYEIRRNIRRGMVDLLAGLHDSALSDGTPRYDRIVVVAHSLGAYIAYDGITSLWAQLNKQHNGQGPEVPAGLADLETAASQVADEPTPTRIAEFQRAQGELWKGMRVQGSPWRITDLITLGAPMYFADRLYTSNRDEFEDRVAKRELPTCPPQTEGTRKNNIHDTKRWFTWKHNGRRVLYHGAPFAVVRWTNMWYPAQLGFFGDWFGGPLQPLYGTGIHDIALTGDRPWRYLPGYAHALYFKMTRQEPPPEYSVTTILRDALELDSTVWLRASTTAAPMISTPP